MQWKWLSRAPLLAAYTVSLKYMYRQQNYQGICSQLTTEMEAKKEHVHRWAVNVLRIDNIVRFFY
jgi:hypothetical protein